MHNSCELFFSCHWVPDEVPLWSPHLIIWQTHCCPNTSWIHTLRSLISCHCQNSCDPHFTAVVQTLTRQCFQWERMEMIGAVRQAATNMNVSYVSYQSRHYELAEVEAWDFWKCEISMARYETHMICECQKNFSVTTYLRGCSARKIERTSFWMTHHYLRTPRERANMEVRRGTHWSVLLWRFFSALLHQRRLECNRNMMESCYSVLQEVWRLPLSSCLSCIEYRNRPLVYVLKLWTLCEAPRTTESAQSKRQQ